MVLGGSFSPEKLNSRTAALVSTMVNDQSSSTGGQQVLFTRLLSVGIPFGWIALPPVTGLKAINGQDAAASGASNGNFNAIHLTANFTEAPATLSRYAGRRTTKRGYFPMLGNLNALFKKTGGGAYELRAPMFLNDMWFTDRSAWRNGSAQSDVWSIQQFSSPPEALSGSANITFSSTGTLTGSGALSGSASITFSSSGTLTGSAALSGTSNISFSSSGTLTGLGALAGSADLVFSASGTLGGLGALSGEANITFSSDGTLSASGALSGTASLVFTSSGTLTGTGALAGASFLSFVSTGTLGGLGGLSGAAQITFSANGELTNAGSGPGPGPVTPALSDDARECLEWARDYLAGAPSNVSMPEEVANCISKHFLEFGFRSQLQLLQALRDSPALTLIKILLTIGA
jgi:hypothetical protein